MAGYRYFRVMSKVPMMRVADVEYNCSRICEAIDEAAANEVDMLVLPELCITGYSCGDLFGQQQLLDDARLALNKIAEHCMPHLSLLIWVGLPLRHRGSLFNCAVALCAGNILAVVPKTYLPAYSEFYEKRWFASARSLKDGDHIDLPSPIDVAFGTDILIDHCGVLCAAEICEDLWTAIPPSSYAAIAGATVIANLSASNEVIGKHDYLAGLIAQQSARCRAAYVYASAGFGESSQDLVYSGNAIIAENGIILAESPRFTAKPQTEIRDIDTQMLLHDRSAGGCFADALLSNEIKEYRVILSDLYDRKPKKDLRREVNPYPFVPSNRNERDKRCAEILSIQSEGLMRRLHAIGCKEAVIGISGGLDSTLALLVTVEAFDRLGLDRKGITGVTMPGFGTTQRTHGNADRLMELLGITIREIPIDKAVRQHFSDIGHEEAIHDVTYENSQARERTQILMDIANQVNGIVIGTGDLSELALGWATYNGDHMSMYGVNVSIPKTLVKYLVGHFAEKTDDKELKEVLLDIIDTPISPELMPADEDGNIKQKTEDLVGPYALHDFFLYNMLRYGFGPQKILYLASKAFEKEYMEEEIKHWLKRFYRRFFTQQFKRSCLPDGPKVGSVSLSPRGDWRMPSDATAKLWIEALENSDEPPFCPDSPF